MNRLRNLSINHKLILKPEEIYLEEARKHNEKLGMEIHLNFKEVAFV